jgi:DNA-binding transcriptional ArsR family regulator
METRRDVFQAIADPTRREIIRLLAGKRLNLNAIAENFDSSRPTISQHIKILVECGVVTIESEGRERYCEARLDELDKVIDWVSESRKLWAHRFKALDSLMEKTKRITVSKAKTKRDGKTKS